MTKGTYVGIDIMKPMAPTQEKLAEIEAEEDAGEFLDQNVDTLEGARNAVRPAGALLILQLVFTLFGGVMAVLIVWNLGTPAIIEATAVIWISAIVLGVLAAFVFACSRIAAVLTALMVALMWMGKIVDITRGDFGGIILGTIFLVFLTGAAVWAVRGSFAYHRLKHEHPPIDGVVG
jgi:hypothetical protein